MNILASIKSEKKMSLKHWRYRLLHWCFGEPWETWDNDWNNSGLPDFLYTHYCPLFHLTNLIAILLPLILLVKIFAALFVAFIKVAKLVGDAIAMLPWDKLEDLRNKLFARPKRPKVVREKTMVEIEAERLKEEKKSLLTRMLRGDYGEDEFERFWNHYGGEYRKLQKEQAETFYVTRMAKIIATKKRVEDRKAKMKQRLIFWTQFSEVFFKWFFNICYILLAVVVFWVLYKITPICFFAIIDLIKLLMTFEIVPFLIFVGTWLVRIVTIVIPIALVIYGFWRFQLIRKSAAAVGSSLVAVSPPFVLLGHWVVLPFKWITAVFNNTLEFVEMFYKENCPPITIISGEDEIIADELNEAE